MMLGAEQVAGRRHDLGYQGGAIDGTFFKEFKKAAPWVLCVLTVKNNFWLQFAPSESPWVIFGDVLCVSEVRPLP